MIDTYYALREQGKDVGQAVRHIAITRYGADSQSARSFMAGWRESVKYADDLESRETSHTAKFGAAAGNAYSDGWTLAASVA